MEKATRQQTKEHNRNLVLKTVFERGSLSRAEIARITRLTRTTVSDIVADLIAEGLVSETGVGPSQVGKPSILLSLVADSRWLIGLDLAHNQFHGAAVNLRGQIRELVSVPVEGRNGAEALSLVYDICDQLIAKARQPLLGIGVGTPGLVNTKEGIVLNAVNLGWKNLPLARLLQEHYRLPVFVLNDSQAAAIGEYTYGSNHQQDKHLVVINIRHGIGAGIVVNGRLFFGDGGSAGEIGHVVVVPQGGELCRCGNRGCLETVASVQALIRQVRATAQQHPELALSHSPQEITLETIRLAYESGDATIRQMVLNTGHYIGVAISHLVGILNIQKVILSGDMTCFGDGWMQAIQDAILHHSIAEPARNTQLIIGQLGQNGIILGASALLANNYSLLFSTSPLSQEDLSAGKLTFEWNTNSY